MLCITVAVADKFTNVLEGKVLGSSKHVDYALFHWKAHDVASLKKPITKFVFVDADDKVTEVIPADQLKARGCNYKTAKRDAAELTDVELAEISGAIELARATPPEPPKKATAPAADPKPAADAPKAFLTPAAAAVGLDEVKLRAEGSQGESQAASQDAEAPEPGETADEQPADNPLATTKPSRVHNKKKRR